MEIVQMAQILVSAPNPTGEAFIRQLRGHQLPFTALVNNKTEKSRLEEMGVKQFLLVDTTDERTWTILEFPVSKVFLFESSLNLVCRYIQLCKAWTEGPIYVITHSINPRTVYKGLGASYVIYSNSQDVSFLL
jgi:hypothetical protein